MPAATKTAYAQPPGPSRPAVRLRDAFIAGYQRLLHAIDHRANERTASEFEELAARAAANGSPYTARHFREIAAAHRALP